MLQVHTPFHVRKYIILLNNSNIYSALVIFSDGFSFFFETGVLVFLLFSFSYLSHFTLNHLGKWDTAAHDDSSIWFMGIEVLDPKNDTTKIDDIHKDSEL